MLLIKYSNLTIIVVFHNNITLVIRFHFDIHVRETFILSIALDMIRVHVYINQTGDILNNNCN